MTDNKNTLAFDALNPEQKKAVSAYVDQQRLNTILSSPDLEVTNALYLGGRLDKYTDKMLEKIAANPVEVQKIMISRERNEKAPAFELKDVLAFQLQEVGKEQGQKIVKQDHSDAPPAASTKECKAYSCLSSDAKKAVDLALLGIMGDQPYSCKFLESQRNTMAANQDGEMVQVIESYEDFIRVRGKEAVEETIKEGLEELGCFPSPQTKKHTPAATVPSLGK